MSDRLLDLQHSLRAFLLAQDYISDASAGTPVPIAVVCEDMGDFITFIDQQLAEASGVCVLIRSPAGTIPHSGTQAPVYEPATIHIRVYENPYRNRSAGGTGQAAAKIADAIVRLLWTFNDSVPGFNPVLPKSRSWGIEEDVPHQDILLECTVPLDHAAPTREESLTDEFGQPLTDEQTQIVTNK